jgi:cation:H+ antiporter
MMVLVLLAKFLGGLALITTSSWVLVTLIGRVGARFHFTAGLLGVAVALGADSPEIASAITALLAGNAELGVGVVLGSNLFNIAALLGVSAMVAGKGLRIRRGGLMLTGGAALTVTLLGSLLVLRWISGWVALALLGVVFVPYVVLSSFGESRLRRCPLPGSLREHLCRAVADVERDERPAEEPKRATTVDVIGIVPALAAVVIGSIVVVSSATALGMRWHVPHTILGMLVLAALTGIPNLVGAMQLARRGRGTAVVSETLNSNSLNVIFGLCLPAALLGASRMKTIPVSICRATRLPRSMFEVMTDPPRPYRESFASRIASSSSFTRIIRATGAKSSWE